MPEAVYVAPQPAQIDYTLQKIGVDLTPEQHTVIYLPNREILVAGGERAGKSFVSAVFVMTRLPFGKLFWLIAQDYARTEQEFLYIQEFLDKLGWSYVASKRTDPGQIEIAGGFLIETKSAADPRRLAAKAPDGVLICEASQVDYETYLRARGRVAEKRGWVMMSGTFESSLGWYPEMFTRGQAQGTEDSLVSVSLPTWSNIKVYPGGRQDSEILRLEEMSSPEWFAERYGGVPSPPKGRVFQDFSMKIHTGIGDAYEFDPDLDVFLCIDPGFATAYSVEVAQIRGDEVYIVDEIFERGFVTQDIMRMAAQKLWWGKVVGGAVDIAARQHQALPAVAEIWVQGIENEGIKGVHLNSQRLEIRDGIERVKSFLIVNPKTLRTRLHINAERCHGLISEFGGVPNPITGQTAVYSWKKDREGNIVGEVPEDKNNHATKALSYWLVDRFGHTESAGSGDIKFF